MADIQRPDKQRSLAKRSSLPTAIHETREVSIPWRPIFLITFWVVLVVVVIYFVAGGWWYSSRIRDDFLAVDADPSLDTPAEIGVEYTDVDVPARFGVFPAWQIAGADDTWVIYVHGHGVSRDETLDLVQIATEAEYPGLVISYRNDSDAPQTSDGLAKYGETEWLDVQGAVEYALDQGAEDVVIAGLGMGGSLALSFAMESDLAGRARALVLDSPVSDLSEVVRIRGQETSLPIAPGNVPGSLAFVAELITAIRFNFDWSRVDYVERAGELNVPMLVLHGEDDELVPVQVSRNLAAAAPQRVQLETFAQAEHVESYVFEPERYRDLVVAFLDANSG